MARNRNQARMGRTSSCSSESLQTAAELRFQESFRKGVLRDRIKGRDKMAARRARAAKAEASIMRSLNADKKAAKAAKAAQRSELKRKREGPFHAIPREAKKRNPLFRLLMWWSKGSPTAPPPVPRGEPLGDEGELGYNLP